MIDKSISDVLATERIKPGVLQLTSGVLSSRCLQHKVLCDDTTVLSPIDNVVLINPELFIGYRDDDIMLEDINVKESTCVVSVTSVATGETVTYSTLDNPSLKLRRPYTNKRILVLGTLYHRKFYNGIGITLTDDMCVGNSDEVYSIFSNPLIKEKSFNRRLPNLVRSVTIQDDSDYGKLSSDTEQLIDARYYPFIVRTEWRIAINNSDGTTTLSSALVDESLQIFMRYNHDRDDVIMETTSMSHRTGWSCHTPLGRFFIDYTVTPVSLSYTETMLCLDTDLRYMNSQTDIMLEMVVDEDGNTLDYEKTMIRQRPYLNTLDLIILDRSDTL